MRLTLTFVLFLSCLLTAELSICQEISQFAICRKVESLEPVGITNHYQPGDKAYAWLKVEGAEVGSQIFIDWYDEDQLTHTSKLTISTSPTMRTYAYKTLYDRGIWKVIVRKRDNTILKEATITVGSDF